MCAVEGNWGVAQRSEGGAHLHATTVALAGSRSLRGVPESLFDFIRDLPEGALVLLRRGMTTKPGLFELTMAAFCKANGVKYEWVMPDPGAGRESTYLRDVAMARRADLVLCYFGADHMAGGTAHMVEAGIAAGTPTYAWGISKDGTHFQRVGEYDMDNVWEGKVPVV